MHASKRSSRSAWLVAGPLFVGSCLLLTWSVYQNFWPDLQAYFEAIRTSGRTSQLEPAVDHARYRRQIQSLIELAAKHIRALGGTCSESFKKGSGGLLDEIDLSKWRGKDPDLALLRVFLLLDDDNRINDHSNYFRLTLPPATTDASLVYLENLSNLRKLNMPGASVTDAGLMHLQRLTRLHSLDLSNTNITGVGIDRLGSLGELSTLDLSGTRVTDAGLDGLASLTSLRGLNLAGTQVSDSSIPRFRSLPRLSQVDVSGTKMTVHGIAEVAQLRPLFHVIFSGGRLWSETLDLDNRARDDLLRDLRGSRDFARSG